MKSKKSQIGNLQSVITTLVVVGILLGVGFLVLEEFMGQMDPGSEAEEGVNETIQAMKKIPTFLAIIVIIAVVGILLAIVFAVLPRAGGTGA
jgi:heme/copper-type cytochrome/quinol oxidase subunit 4